MTRTATTVSPSSCAARKARATPTTLILRLTMIGAALVALASGLALWSGHAAVVHGLHTTTGMVLLIGLVTAAVMGGRAGAPPELLGLAVTLDVVAIGVASGQRLLLVGEWHWVIKVLHLATMAAAMMTASRLLDRVERAARGEAGRS